MMWILWAAICFGIAIILYSSIEDKVPENLKFGSSPVFEVQNQAVPDKAGQDSSASRQARSNQAWMARTSQGVLELSRDANEPIQTTAGPVYDAPSFFITCKDNQLYAWWEMRVPALKANEHITVQVNGKPQVWRAGAEFRVFSSDAKLLMTQLMVSKISKFELPLEENPNYKFTLTTSGLASHLKQFPSTCLE